VEDRRAMSCSRQARRDACGERCQAVRHSLHNTTYSATRHTDSIQYAQANIRVRYCGLA
jgi:hypothetical protein